MADRLPNNYPALSQHREAFHLPVIMKIVLVCAAMLGLLWGLYALRTILLLLLLSLLLSYLLEPIVRTFASVPATG